MTLAHWLILVLVIAATMPVSFYFTVRLSVYGYLQAVRRFQQHHPDCQCSQTQGDEFDGEDQA